MSSLFIPLLVIVFAIYTGAHNEASFQRCGTKEYNDALLAEYPELQASLDKFEREWADESAAIESGTIDPYSQQYRWQITIPLIFTVVFRSPEFYPDWAISAQIARLNRDFSATNRDYTSGTPQEFQSVRSGNTGIRFTFGGRRNMRNTRNEWPANNEIKVAYPYVDPTRKLNIWVCSIEGGILGIASFPGVAPEIDGIMLDDQTLPDVNPNSPYNRGRTATHEVGHWLYLRHIWGDDSSCDNQQDRPDFVTDTPPSNQPNYGCPAGTKRCSNNPYSQDMYMNYMDYSHDRCLVMFTKGQIERAWASIRQYRQGFDPQNIRYSDKEYINWLYFNRFEGHDVGPNEKCFGDDILFYEHDINEGSDSNIHIYGCMMKTNNMNIDHMTDIKFIFNNNNNTDSGDDDSDMECDDDYTQATQDLNEGNTESIYLCYKTVESDPGNGNMAILDITFIKQGDGDSGDDVMSLNYDKWTINRHDNINPNGFKLNFAMKKGEFYTIDDDEEKDVNRPVPNETDGGVESDKPASFPNGIAINNYNNINIDIGADTYIHAKPGFGDASDGGYNVIHRPDEYNHDDVDDHDDENEEDMMRATYQVRNKK